MLWHQFERFAKRCSSSPIASAICGPRCAGPPVRYALPTMARRGQKRAKGQRSHAVVCASSQPSEGRGSGGGRRGPGTSGGSSGRLARAGHSQTRPTSKPIRPEGSRRSTGPTPQRQWPRTPIRASMDAAVRAADMDGHPNASMGSSDTWQKVLAKAARSPIKGWSNSAGGRRLLPRRAERLPATGHRGVGGCAEGTAF